MLLGEAVEKMSDAELADAAEKTTLFARLTPAHKAADRSPSPQQGTCGRLHGRRNQRCSRIARADSGISVDTAVDIAKSRQI